jgi:2-desacetyl-2-hydroxyethyl bacteriochlorophyllide A dehydrogenase
VSIAAHRVVFRRPGVAALEPFDFDDGNLAPTEAIVRTRATLISPGTELANLHDRLGVNPAAPPRTYPLTGVGYANVGTVVAAGADLNIQPGQRVYSMGFHASHVRVDARDRFCVPVPDGLADEAAVFVRLANVSMTTMKTTVARGGDPVAVVGLGLVGNLAAQVFQACGCEVNAFDLSPTRRAIAQRCGIRSVHDAAVFGAFANHHRLVVEATGAARALASAVGLAANGGEIVMIGAPWGGSENAVPSSDLLRDVFFRFLRLRSGSEWEIPRTEIVENARTGLGWLSDGRLRAEPLITHRIDPERIQGAYDGLRDRKDDYLGVVLQWQ